MPQTRVPLAAATWVELDPAVHSQHFAVIAEGTDIVLQMVSDGVAPGTEVGDALANKTSAEVVLAQDFAGSVWAKSTAGASVMVDNYGPAMVLVGQTVAGT